MSTELAKASLPLSGRASLTAFLSRSWWLIAVFVLVYGQILALMAQAWWTNDDYAHGLFIPFALAYLVHERREKLLSIPASPSVVGFFAILASQALLLVGYLGAEFFLQRVSMVVFFAGLILFVWGWRALSETAFGLVLIVLVIPLPAIIFNAIALPLQLLASAFAESLLHMLRVPIYREGNILQIPHQLLNVAEACSGIRSLISLLALATLTTMFGFFLSLRWWVRIAFIMTAVPVALAANAFRVAGTGLLAYWFGEKAAMGFFHAFSGWLVFMLAFAVLLVELFFLRRFVTPGNTVTE